MTNEQSRNEAILKSILGKEPYTGKPESRIEALLIAVGEMIKSGGSTPEEIQEYVSQYLASHPEVITGVDKTQLENALKEVFN